MLAYIHVMPLARCVGHANNKDVQNDVPHSLTAAQNRCIKSMPKMALQKYSFSKLVFIQGDSIRLIVSAAIIAVSTLVFGSSKVAPNTYICLAKSGNVATVALMGSEVYNQKM